MPWDPHTAFQLEDGDDGKYNSEGPGLRWVVEGEHLLDSVRPFYLPLNYLVRSRIDMTGYSLT